MCSIVKIDEKKMSVIREAILKVNEYIEVHNNKIELVDFASENSNIAEKRQNPRLQQTKKLQVPSENMIGIDIPKDTKIVISSKNDQHIVYEINDITYKSDDEIESITMDIIKKNDNNIVGYLHLGQRHIPIRDQSIIIVSGRDCYEVHKGVVRQVDYLSLSSDMPDTIIYADGSLKLYNAGAKDITARDIVNEKCYTL